MTASDCSAANIQFYAGPRDQRHDSIEHQRHGLHDYDSCQVLCTADTLASVNL